MATYSSILAWRIPRTVEPGGLQSVGSQRVGHDWKTNTKFSSVQVWDFPCGQDCASPVGGMGSIHGWGTKILHAVWYSQKIIFKKMCPDLGLKLYQLVWACRLKTREKYKKANSLLLFWPYGTFQKPSGQPYRTPGISRCAFLKNVVKYARYWILGAGALGWPRGMVWGGRREEGSEWGTHVYLWQIHFDIWQNQYNIVKLN